MPYEIVTLMLRMKIPKNFRSKTKVQSNRLLVSLTRRIFKMSEDKISVNEMITTCPEQYLNAHLKVTRKVVYDINFFWIISSSAHSGYKTTIENGTDTSLLG